MESRGEKFIAAIVLIIKSIIFLIFSIALYSWYNLLDGWKLLWACFISTFILLKAYSLIDEVFKGQK